MGAAAESQRVLLLTVSVGMGAVVTIVVIILLNLLLQSVRALDKRVDHVWSSAVGLFVHTLTAAPQLRSAQRHATSVEDAAHQNINSVTVSLSRPGSPGEME